MSSWLSIERQSQLIIAGDGNLLRLTSTTGGAVYWDVAAAAKLLQSCQTLCDTIDGSPPGSPVPGILQARILEWVAIPFSSA